MPAPSIPPDWLLNPIRLAPVALDSPEYSVLIGRDRHTEQAAAHHGHYHRRPESKVKPEAHQPQSPICGNQNGATPASGDKRCAVAAHHLR